jgi:hypothetical protein
MTTVPLHKPRFAVIKCSDGRLQLVLKSVCKDSSPGLFFAITNAGGMLPPYLFHKFVGHPLEIVFGAVLNGCSALRMGLLNSRFGRSEKAKLRLERFIQRAHYLFGWLAISGTYGAFRYAVAAKEVRHTLIVVHEACGAHEVNLGPKGKDMWNRVIKENALGTMNKLKGMPEARLVESWHLWFVSFSKRGIQGYDHTTKEWRVLTVADIERILDTRLEVDSVEELFKEVWTDPASDGQQD